MSPPLRGDFKTSAAATLRLASDPRDVALRLNQLGRHMPACEVSRDVGCSDFVPGARRLRNGEAHCVESDGAYVFDVRSEWGERSWLWYSAADCRHGISGRGTSCDRKDPPPNGQQPARDGAHPGHRAVKASAETQRLSRTRRRRSNPPIGSRGPRRQRGWLAARVG